MSVQPPSSLDEIASLSAVPESLLLLQQAKAAGIPVASSNVFPPQLWQSLIHEGISLHSSSSVLHDWQQAYANLNSPWVRIGSITAHGIQWQWHITGHNTVLHALSQYHLLSKRGPLWVIMQSAPAAQAHGMFWTKHPTMGTSSLAQMVYWPGEPDAVVDSEEPAEIIIRSSDQFIVHQETTAITLCARKTKSGELELSGIDKMPSIPEKAMLTLIQQLLNLKRNYPEHLQCFWTLDSKKNLYITDIVAATTSCEMDYHLEKTKTRVLLATGSPGELELTGRETSDGVGLLRSDYVWSELQQHPLWLFTKRKSELRKHLLRYLERATNVYPTQRVLYRLQNFTSSELLAMHHGKEYEETESNPYIGRRGMHWYLANPAFLHFELEVLHAWASKRHAPCGVILPFIRDESELRRALATVEKMQLAHLPQFEIWMQLNTPENVDNLPRYLLPQLKGVIVHMQTISALGTGIDPDEDELTIEYSPSDNWIISVLTTIKNHVNNTPGRWQTLVYTPENNATILEQVVSLGYDGVITSPQVVPMIRAQLRQCEHSLRVQKDIWQ